MKREAAIRLALAAALAEIAARPVLGDKDDAWLREAGVAIDGLNLVAGQLKYARALSADVAHATTPRERRLARHREQEARRRTFNNVVAVLASLLAALADHPFTAEQPDYPAMKN